MLLTITNKTPIASDLGYLLHKNPARSQAFRLAYGKAHVFYPEASESSCTAALLLDVDPIGLVRNRRGPAGEGYSLAQYVNDRPYVGSSFLSVAIAQVYGTALQGRSKERQEVADRPLSLVARIAVLPCRGGESFLRKLFEPLGYEITATRHGLDETFPDWGESSYFTVELQGQVRLQDLLGHLYVLIPVLDNDKHYFVSHDEVEKLLKRGEGWLATHPARDEITRRFLKHQKGLTRQALARLTEDNDPDETDELQAREEAQVEESISLNEQRLGAVTAALRGCGARTVIDLGCGEGKLLQELFKDRSFEKVAGMDVSSGALEKAHSRLRWERLPDIQKKRLDLFQGSLMYRDRRLEDFDAAAVVEVIEHLDPPRLAAFERVVFEFSRPRVVVVTTPNVEYNVKFETLPAGRFRHRDHRFEWTRSEFQTWAKGVADRFFYRVRFLPIGTESVDVGSPTQMAVFER